MFDNISHAQNQQKSAQTHRCFKNWSQSSSAMEPALIAEGFCESESMHGLRYNYIIGEDGNIYEGRGTNKGAHTVGKNSNSNTIGIAILGDFRGKLRVK